MVTAIVLIRTERLQLQQTAEALLEIDEVKEVYSVAGEYDLVAIVRVHDVQQTAHALAVTHGIERAWAEAQGGPP